jgi:hypothetical protein
MDDSKFLRQLGALVIFAIIGAVPSFLVFMSVAIAYCNTSQTLCAGPDGKLISLGTLGGALLSGLAAFIIVGRGHRQNSN